MNVQEAIDNMMLVLKEYEKYQSDIHLYLELVDKQKEFVLSGKEMLDYSTGKIDETVFNNVSDHIQKTKSLLNAAVLYNAIIISLYGNFERYVDDLLTAYVCCLGTEYTQYDSLPDGLREKHIKKAADYLANEQRYKSMALSKESVIAQLFNCLVENKTDSLPKEFFIRHGGNLKTDELISLFSSFGFNNVDGYLKNTKSFRDFQRFAELDNPDEWKEILDDLVAQRNQVAHGRVENRVALSDLSSRYIPVLNAICKSLIEIIVEKVLSELFAQEKLVELNPIIQVWNKKIVGINVGDKRFFVGERLVAMSTKNHFWEATVITIESNHKKVQKTRASNVNIAIELSIEVKENYRLFVYKDS